MLGCIAALLWVAAAEPSLHSPDLMADSPVVFPKEGALPARFPPDQPARDFREPEPGTYLFSSPERSLAQIRAIQAAMPAGVMQLPRPDWSHLAQTRRALTRGGSLRIVALGDSIVNDAMRSGWIALLQEAYPSAEIRCTVVVRGGGGCQHYREEDRIGRLIAPLAPDLVLIGGISQRSVEDVAEVVRQLRVRLPKVEILLATGAFGTADPRVAAELEQANCSGTGDYGRKLRALARTERCAFVDMTAPWAEYMRSARVHPHLFYRDVVHANEYGEQVLGAILAARFGVRTSVGAVQSERGAAGKAR